MTTPQFGDNTRSPGETSSQTITEHIVAAALDHDGWGTQAGRRQP